MSNYMTKAAAHARLLKLASAARLIRRQRALQKYAQAVQMQKAALSTGAQAGIGAGLGGLIGGGIGYGLGKKDKKLLSTLIGAGAGAGIGGLGGYGLGKYLNGKNNSNAVDSKAIIDALSPEVTLPGKPRSGDDLLEPPEVSDISLSPVTRKPTFESLVAPGTVSLTASPETMIATTLSKQGPGATGVVPYVEGGGAYLPQSGAIDVSNMQLPQVGPVLNPTIRY